MGKRPHPDTATLSAEELQRLHQPTETPPSKGGLHRKKRELPVASHTEQKRKDRKRAYLQAKKQKTAQREALMASIHAHSQLSEDVKDVLIPSTELGQSGSLRTKLKRELKRRKMGIAADETVPLMVPVLHCDDPDPLPLKKPKIAVAVVPSDSSESDVGDWVKDSSGEETQVHTVVPQELDLNVLAGFSLADTSAADVGGRKLYVSVERTAAIQAARSELPIVSMEREVTEAILDHPFTIICGATGSGKSTQVPQFLYELGFSHPSSPFPGKIGITQPRRVAAMTLAQRVADELNLPFGREVGYQIRFDVHTIDAEQNRIKFMTDGILLKEVETDFLLSQYSVIIIDEAHERSVNTDILLGMLARIVPLREKLSVANSTEKVTALKVVIMSATLRIDDFVSNSQLFPTPPPVVNVEARQYPVAIHYAKNTDREDYLEVAFNKVLKIHRGLPAGGILVFLTGKRDVDHLRAKLKYELRKEAATVLPLYSMLSPKKQLKVFDEHANRRLIVIATNIAETSLTIPTVKYVVDCGLEKRKVFAGKLQMSAYVVDWISRSSADQRSGRAGRLSPGHCYRLYTLAAYHRFPAFRPPQILTCPIEGTILLLKSMGIKDVVKFPFPTRPEETAIRVALEMLISLGALAKAGRQQSAQRVDDCTVTDIGREMAKLPISPRYSKMLVVGKRLHISEFIVLTAAGLSTEQVFGDDVQTEEGKSNKAAVKKMHAKWQDGRSDALGLLHVSIAFFRDRAEAEEKSKFEEQFCKENCLNVKSMREIGELSCQLLSELDGCKATLDTHFGSLSLPSAPQYESILKCIVAGFIDRVAMADPDPQDTWKQSKKVPYLTSEQLDVSLYSEEYKALNPEKEYTFVHPSSYLFGRHSPEMLVYQDLMFTSRPYMRCITSVKPEWLNEFGSHLIHPSPPLSSPPPTVASGVLRCWVEPAFGPKCWRLAMIQVNFPEDDETVELWTLRFLMEGKLVEEWGECKGLWKVKVGNVTNKEASGTQMQVAKAAAVLKRNRIFSRPALFSAPPTVLSSLQKCLTPLLKPSSLPRFSDLWSRSFPL